MTTTLTDINVKISLNDSYTNVVGAFTRSNDPSDVIMEIMQRIRVGTLRGKVFYHAEHTTTQAAQTVTFDSSAGSADDIVTINGIVFTVKAAPSNDPAHGEYLLYADNDTAQGAAFAAAWNAHPIARFFGVAVNVTGTVTITTHQGGTLFNQGSLTTSNALFAAVGAATFAAGAAGTTVVELNVAPKATNVL